MDEMIRNILYIFCYIYFCFVLQDLLYYCYDNFCFVLQELLYRDRGVLKEFIYEDMLVFNDYDIMKLCDQYSVCL